MRERLHIGVALLAGVAAWFLIAYVSGTGFGVLNERLHFGHIATALGEVVLNLGGFVIGLLVYSWVIEIFYPVEKT
jgi:hypothetical protein